MKKIMTHSFAWFLFFYSNAISAQNMELDYKIYSQVLMEHFASAPGRELRIVARTSGYQLDETAVNRRCMAILPADLITRHNALNATRLKFEDKFAFPNGMRYILIDAANGIALSRIAFNDSRAECLFYLMDNRMPLAAHGYVLRLKKENSEWKTINRCRLW